jgi:putative nucleotidyltransferase with HDIG domain
VGIPFVRGVEPIGELWFSGVDASDYGGLDTAVFYLEHRHEADDLGSGPHRLWCAVVVLRIAYRVKQFVSALVASVQPMDVIVLPRYLSSAEVELFLRQDAALQQHSLRVLRILEDRGCRDAVLLEAALLHDVGKSEGRIKLWHRVAKVLLDVVSPALSERLGADDAGSWRYQFYVQAHHPDLGAEMIRVAGGESSVAELIADHHTPVGETKRRGLDAERLISLQRADKTA